jgi:hypothetical protein
VQYKFERERVHIYKQVICSMRFLGANDVLRRGSQGCKGGPFDIKLFKKHYGSHPAVLARMWDDMGETILLEKDKTEKGFKFFLIATHFLWAYPKNGELLASRFGVGLRQVQGENLWRWVQIIAALKKKKFVWPEQTYNDPNGHIYIVSVDGVDFKVWEMKHPTMTIDKGGYSHKFNHGALKYEIAIDIYTSKVVWISRMHKAGVHDKVIFHEKNGLQEKIPQGKKAITDRVYGSKALPGDHAAPPPSKNEGWIKWRASKARIVLMQDLIDGILPVESSRISAEDAWDIYKTMEEFATVVFSQFKARLQDHRKQISDNKIRAARELEFLVHDKSLFPRQKVNHRGELVFDLHPAKRLLRADIKAGKHLSMTPQELHVTNGAYQMFTLDIFRMRIYQEVRRSKFLNHLKERRAKGLF